MFGFFLKKSFFDGWDNLLWIIVFNLLLVGLFAGGFYAINAIMSVSVLLSIVVFTMFISLFMTIIFAVNKGCANIVNYKSLSYKETFTLIKSVWKDAVCFGLLFSTIIILAVLAIFFYISFNSIIGLLVAAMIFWVLFIIVLALQWFLPLYAQLEGGLKTLLKKSFILFFDNTSFSIILFFYSLVLAACTFVFFFLAPGLVGIIMAQNNALKLRVYKYDWLEKQSVASRKIARNKIPWEELLDVDKELVGTRTFKNFIFPWKD